MEIKGIGRDSFDASYDEFAERIYRNALYYSGDHHTAEDITQNVLLKWCTREEDVSDEKIEAWVKSVVRNQLLNQRRHEKFEVNIEINDMRQLIESRSCEKSVEEFLECRYRTQLRIDLVREIYDSLYRKNPRWYDAAMMTYVLEKPQKEVADDMGITIGSLRIMLYRAKNWIRKKYQKKLDHLNKA